MACRRSSVRSRSGPPLYSIHIRQTPAHRPHTNAAYCRYSAARAAPLFAQIPSGWLQVTVGGWNGIANIPQTSDEENGRPDANSLPRTARIFPLLRPAGDGQPAALSAFALAG